MRIIIKVMGYEKDDKNYEALINQFELVVPGDTKKFAVLVDKIIEIISELPPDAISTAPGGGSSNAAGAGSSLATT